MFFRRSLRDEIACAEVLSAIALLLYRETAAVSTVDVSSSHISRTAALLVPMLQLGNALLFVAQVRQSCLIVAGGDVTHLLVSTQLVKYLIVPWLLAVLS